MGSLRTDSSSASSVHNLSSPIPFPPSNDDIEAVIQMATSARSSPDGRAGPVKDTRTQLFVGNLPYRVRWQDLKDLFRKAGTVLRADVSLGPDNRSRGYGTVLLATAEDAGRAVDMFNGYSWQTRVLEVRPDRLPPDLDNPLGPSPPGQVFPTTVGNMPHSLSLLPYGPASQSNPLLPTLGMTQGIADDFDYQSLYNHENIGLSGSVGRNLFVGNLPFHCQWQDLKDLFRQAGTIIRADVALGQDGRSRGFGTVVFANDIDAERAVKMFNGYEFNGRVLKVHHDKFSQTSQPTTAPTSPTLQPTYQPSSSFGSHSGNPPNHIPMPMGYRFELGTSSGPNSPYDSYPPNVSIPQPHHSQAHSISVDRLAASLASTSLGGNSSSSHDRTNSHSSSQQHHAHPGPISLPPPPPANAFPIPAPHTLSPHTLSPLHHPMSPMQHHPHHHPSMTPHGLPPITPSMPPFSFLPQPSPHGHPGSPSNNMQSVNTSQIHAAHVLSTFSPGVAMSPGTFWGRPGGGANPFINPAVGAPVHGSPGGFFGMNMSSAASLANSMDEPGGYFPPVPEAGYFPPMPSSSLANEILRDKSGDDRTPGSSSSGATNMGRRDEEYGASSLATTSWHKPQGTKASDIRDAEDKEASSSFLPDDANDDIISVHAIARTNSMSVSGKTADRIPMIRGGSDPVQAHIRIQGTRSVQGRHDSANSQGDAGERRKTGFPGVGSDHTDR